MILLCVWEVLVSIFGPDTTYLTDLLSAGPPVTCGDNTFKQGTLTKHTLMCACKVHSGFWPSNFLKSFVFSVINLNYMKYLSHRTRAHPHGCFLRGR